MKACRGRLADGGCGAVKVIRGHSLAEVLVAAALFAALLVTLSWVYVQMTRSQRQADPQAEAARTAVLALEKVRAELRDALVTDVPRQAGQVRYRSLLRDAQGRPLTGASLSLEYGPERTMRVDQGVLQRLEAGHDPQPLARLGEGGSITFDRPAGQLDLLQITVLAVVNGREHEVASAVLLGQSSGRLAAAAGLSSPAQTRAGVSPWHARHRPDGDRRQVHSPAPRRVGPSLTRGTSFITRHWVQVSHRRPDAWRPVTTPAHRRPTELDSVYPCIRSVSASGPFLKSPPAILAMSPSARRRQMQGAIVWLIESEPAPSGATTVWIERR